MKLLVCEGKLGHLLEFTVCFLEGLLASGIETYHQPWMPPGRGFIDWFCNATCVCLPETNPAGARFQEAFRWPPRSVVVQPKQAGCPAVATGTGGSVLGVLGWECPLQREGRSLASRESQFTETGKGKLGLLEGSSWAVSQGLTVFQKIGSTACACGSLRCSCVGLAGKLPPAFLSNSVFLPRI